MTGSETVQDFIGRAEHIHGNLKDIGVDLGESTLVAKIVSDLTKDFNNFKSNWCGTTAVQQTLSCLLPRLMAEEQIRSEKGNEESEAIVSEALRSNKNKNAVKGKLHEQKAISTCDICKKKGHWEDECWSNPVKTRDQNGLQKKAQLSSLKQK